MTPPKCCTGHYFRTILANDGRPRTMHAEAEHTDREQLPDVIGRLLDHWSPCEDFLYWYQGVVAALHPAARMGAA
jgi:hypothetical protein